MKRLSIPKILTLTLASTALFCGSMTLNAQKTYQSQRSKMPEATERQVGSSSDSSPTQTQTKYVIERSPKAYKSQRSKVPVEIRSYDSRRSNFLGLIDVRTNSYSIPKPTTVALSTDELVGRKSYSGNEIRLLWGAITIIDY